MGEEVILASPPTVTVLVAGTAPLTRVELIRGERVVEIWKDGGLDLTATWQDTSLTPTFYRLRVLQTDGEMAWTSPIWVTPQQGIS
jgi:hypothetical protein